MILNYLYLLNELEDPININIKFNSIGFYNYNYNLDLINYGCKDIKNDFKFFIKHPLIYWNLELIFKTKIVLIDLIGNLTTNPSYRLGYLTVNGINFVNDPSMVFKQGEFLKNFTVMKNQPQFKLQNNICSSIDFQNKMLNSLKNSKCDNGIFLQRGNLNSLSILKVKGLLFNCKF